MTDQPRALYGHGKCPECGDTVPLTITRVTVRHDRPDQLGRCDGSHRKPTKRTG